MINMLRLLTLEKGTDKHKRYEKYHPNLAYELRNIPGSELTVKTDIYSMGYIFSKISRQVKSNLLQTLSLSMMSNNSGKSSKVWSKLF